MQTTQRSDVRQDMTRREQYGHIINISSMSAHRVPNGASGGSFYAATKHALRAITEGLRQEVTCLPARLALPRHSKASWDPLGVAD